MKEKSMTLCALGLVLGLAGPSGALPPGKDPAIPDKFFDASSSLAGSHDPKRLGDFILPEIVIDGLTLEVAVDRLKVAYENACQQTSETPIALGFNIPAATQKRLSVKLPSASFQVSVMTLASLAQMKAERHGAEYRFSAIEGGGKVTKTVQVPPDFCTQLEKMSQSSGKRLPAAELLANVGVIADRNAPADLKPNGNLILTEMPAAEVETISNFISAAFSTPPTQIKFTITAAELTPDAAVMSPEVDSMTDAQAEDFKNTVATKKGAKLSPLPTVTAKVGEEAAIENVRNFPKPVSEERQPLAGLRNGRAVAGAEAGAMASDKKPLLGQTGQVAHVAGTLVGLKINVKFDYTDTVGSISQTTHNAELKPHAKFQTNGFFTDGSTRLFSQTREDGSKTLLLVKSEIIDAMGRPYRESH